MPDLFERLFPGDPDASNIPVHAFSAAMVDYATGNTTRQQIVNVVSLDAEAEADLDKLCNAVDALSGFDSKVRFALEFDAVCLLAAHGYKYTTKADFKSRLDL